jgi:hypothetical protein
MKMTFDLCGHPPLNSKAQSRQEKNSRQMQIEEHFINYLISTLKN